MNDQAPKLKDLVTQSQRILITSHLSPDPDAVCSAILLTESIKLNHPSKKTLLTLEEEPNRDLTFLKGFEQIRFQPSPAALKDFNPDLLIIVDANNLRRCSREDIEILRRLLTDNEIKTIIIDHHEPHDVEANNLYINESYPATCQQIYHSLFDRLKWQKPAGFVEITLLGIISDTLRFKYKNPKHRETFALVSELLEQDGDIEALENKLESYSKAEIEVFGELARNLKVREDYNYTFVSDQFAERWVASAKSKDDFKKGCELFVNQFIRNIENNKWGFVIYQEMMSAEDVYAVSLRSQSGLVDVSLIAKELGGGGHKPAAGAKIQALNLQAAIVRVEQAIANYVQA